MKTKALKFCIHINLVLIMVVSMSSLPNNGVNGRISSLPSSTVESASGLNDWNWLPLDIISTESSEPSYYPCQAIEFQ